MLYYLEEAPERWIINVDLDYFFCNDKAGNRRLIFSQDYIASVFLAIRAHQDACRVVCLTLCQTPDEEYTAGGRRRKPCVRPRARFSVCRFRCRRSLTTQ